MLRLLPEPQWDRQALARLFGNFEQARKANQVRRLPLQVVERNLPVAHGLVRIQTHLDFHAQLRRSPTAQFAPLQMQAARFGGERSCLAHPRVGRGQLAAIGELQFPQPASVGG